MATERLTAGLKKEDFRIYEDGIEQKLAVFERESGLPLSIAMALDTSMSTRKDLPLEVASARKFAHTMLRPVDSIRSTSSPPTSRRRCPLPATSAVWTTP